MTSTAVIQARSTTIRVRVLGSLVHPARSGGQELSVVGLPVDHRSTVRLNARLQAPHTLPRYACLPETPAALFCGLWICLDEWMSIFAAADEAPDAPNSPSASRLVYHLRCGAWTYRECSSVNEFYLPLSETLSM